MRLIPDHKLIKKFPFKILLITLYKYYYKTGCTTYLIQIVNIKRVIRKKINILQALSKPCHWKIKVGPRHAFRGFLRILIFQDCVDEMKYSSLDIDIPLSCHKSECDNYLKSHEIDRFYK